MLYATQFIGYSRGLRAGIQLERAEWHSFVGAATLKAFENGEQIGYEQGFAAGRADGYAAGRSDLLSLPNVEATTE